MKTCACFDGREEKNKRVRKNCLEFHLDETCFYYNQFELLSTFNYPDKGKRHSPEKSLKSWKQILVELWTSHYFSVCLQTLSTARCLPQKGRTKGGVIAWYNPPLLSAISSFLYFSFPLFDCLSQLSTTDILFNFLPHQFILFMVFATRTIWKFMSSPHSKVN